MTSCGTAPVPVAKTDAGVDGFDASPPVGDSDGGAGTADASAACGAADSLCPDGCTWVDDDDCAMCDPAVGMLTPMLPCSPAHPCTSVLITYTDETITDPPLSVIDFDSFVPTCATGTNAILMGRTAHDDGEPIATTMGQATRYHCEYRPAGTSAAAPRPLLIYVHGSGGYANTVLDATSLRDKAPSFDFYGDCGRPGFVLVAAQGRNLHWPTAMAQDGSKHDTFFRDFSAPSQNQDIAYYDHLIDTLVTEGVVDPSRIYISGWSNGARFASLYGIARNATPTPGGNYIAAVANYSGGDPFSNTAHGQEPSCQASTYPTSSVPHLIISRTCDAVACNAAQDAAYLAASVETSPGNVAETWVNTLRTDMANPNVTWTLITGFGTTVTEGSCTASPPCTATIALLNHLRWPDGLADNSGIDHEPAMLEFMKSNPRP